MIRILTPDDAAAFQALRLRGLRESPAAFGSTYENEVDTPLEQIAERLVRGAGREDVMFGAFDDDGGALVGLAGLARQNGPKSRHRAGVWGMYVAPEARGRGAGRALISALIAHARTLDGVERLVLGVESGNKAARALYHSFGFATYGIEPEAYKLNGKYWDSEMMSLSLKKTAQPYTELR
ncbi:GNAT family N-acetyltransferase [Longimicrobium sp.]|uniref:GNAT family N-acetyltransferase n=1 Tax=Longimicrobium sp. TaxID=2029185 RepID=UPI003B3AF787